MIKQEMIWTVLFTLFILVIHTFCNGFIYYTLPKSQWECTARDVRPNHGQCVEYHVKERE